MLTQSHWWKGALAVALAAAAWGGTFGRAVSIGGHASSLALDESRSVLYIANFTANRIEVMSLADNTIQTSINVAAQPSSLALSPDDRFLVVTHFGNTVPPASAHNAVTIIDLTTNGQQIFALGSPPLGVAFGIDGLALLVTSTDFLLLDPGVWKHPGALYDQRRRG
jgi:DNA-binding beta-propeller fold protein YncE